MCYLNSCLLIIYCLTTSSLWAAEAVTKIIDVPANTAARQNVVVQFPLDLAPKPPGLVTLIDTKSGQVIPAQLTRPSIAHPERKAGSELVFVMDSIPANESRKF